MPRPRSLTADRIGAAALAVVDRDGLAALTIRGLADELGIGAMSLYRYVAGRDEIDELVVAQVLAGIDDDGADGATTCWEDRLRELARRAHEAASAHPETVPLLVRYRHRVPATLAWGEAVLTALADTGLDAPTRAIAFRSLQALVFGTVQLERHGPIDGRATRELTGRTDDHPQIAAAAAAASDLSPDAVFDGAFALWLAGVRSTSAPTSNT